MPLHLSPEAEASIVFCVTWRLPILGESELADSPVSRGRLARASLPPLRPRLLIWQFHLPHKLITRETPAGAVKNNLGLSWSRYTAVCVELGRVPREDASAVG